MNDERPCEMCARYEPNKNYDPNALFSARGYCKIPVRDTGGLLGDVEVGDGLNVTFARSKYRCNEGRNWFQPIAALNEKEEV